MKTLAMNVIKTETAVFFKCILDLYTLKNIMIAKIPLVYLLSCSFSEALK